jgi:glutathione synthase/RimK-type ligase-like ATP-grasp enzyme
MGNASNFLRKKHMLVVSDLIAHLILLRVYFKILIICIIYLVQKNICRIKKGKHMKMLTVLGLILTLMVSFLTYGVSNKPRIAVLTSHEKYDSSNYLLIPAFDEIGLEYEEVIWDAPSIDWQRYDAVLIRSTWDYIQATKFEKFLQTLSSIERLKIPLYNSSTTVMWNSKKTYLRELAEKGINTIDTIFTSRQKTPYIHKSLEQLGGNEWIIKPVISAGANKTFRVNIHTAQKIYQSNYDPDEEVMIQPFISEIVTRGEMSIVFFNGNFSHAVQQIPASGDFRVQYIHGATLKPFLPDPWILNETRHILNIAKEIIGEEFPFLYARVDVVEHNNTLYLMELELIEPTLHLDCKEGSAKTFAIALQERIGLGSR